VNCGLLVAHQYVLEFVLLEDGVVDVQYGTAWIAKDVFYAFFSQQRTSISAPVSRFAPCVASVFMKHSFQGPLEIDRMFFPDEVWIPLQLDLLPCL
jgi:hypothetical protein